MSSESISTICGDGYSQIDDANDVDSLSLPISERAKARVRRVDPCQARCLVENVATVRGIKYTHCFPRRLTEDPTLLSSLEWFWGMKCGTLNLDTRYNIFPVGASLHFIYDQPGKKPSWFLLPEEDIIRQFFATLTKVDRDTRWRATRGILPKFEATTFKYRLMPMPLRMHDVAIVHQHTVPDLQKECIIPNHFRVHVHPFDDLPLLTSHLDPKFVILEAGRKLSLIPMAYMIDIFTENPSLKLVLRLYAAWTSPAPVNALNDKDFNPCDEDDGELYETDSNSTHTTERRCSVSGSHTFQSVPSSKRKREECSDCVEPENKQKRHSNNLSRRSLDKHTGNIGGEMWSKQSITLWSESLPRDIVDAHD